ncbi:hypothetical protein TNCV_198921 [Trichonephila clavipes]|nr:hypothetical protein TNCV_198921 [Trichonephila clavipes]
MFEEVTKEDFIMVLHEMSGNRDTDMGILELKQKLLSCKMYLEDICDLLDTTREDRMEEKCSEREQKNAAWREKIFGISQNIEARRKTENETRIREAKRKEETETRLKAEEQAILRSKVEARL